MDVAICCLLKFAPRAIPPQHRHQIDVALLRALMLSNNSPSPHQRAIESHSSTTMALIACPAARATMLQCLLHSAQAHAHLHPTTLSAIAAVFAAHINDANGQVQAIARQGLQMLDGWVHPRAPILTKRALLEREWQEQQQQQEESEGNKMEGDDDKRNLYSEQSAQTDRAQPHAKVVQTVATATTHVAVQTTVLVVELPRDQPSGLDDQQEPSSPRKRVRTDEIDAVPAEAPAIPSDTDKQAAHNIVIDNENGDDDEDLGDIDIVDADPDAE